MNEYSKIKNMPESYNDNLHKEAIGKLYQYGRELRQELTEAEKLLWNELRNRKKWFKIPQTASIG